MASKVIQRIDLHHKCSNIDGISWSMDNRLAVVTNSYVTIINITGVHSEERKKESKLKIRRSAIAVEDKPANVSVDVDTFEKRLQKFPLSVAPYFSTAVIDPALSPNILKQTGYEDVTNAKWSPVGCDRTGRFTFTLRLRTQTKLTHVFAKRYQLHQTHASSPKQISKDMKSTPEISNITNT